MGIALVEAARLARANRAHHEELEDRHTALTSRVDRESTAQQQRRQQVYRDVLVPFRDTFSRLKNVDLAELADIELPGTPTPQIELAQVRLSALHTVGALAGGLSAGAGAGVGAFTAVGALAVASTGTSISALSGAAATSATLAWFGGGAIAAGGYGMSVGAAVLGGLVAAPALVATAGVVSWQGRRQKRKQVQTPDELRQADAELTDTEQNANAVITRGREVRNVLDHLATAATAPLARLQELVDADDDYASYPPTDRAQVATVVALVTTAVAVLAAPLAADDGTVTELSRQVLADARDRLDDLQAAQ